MGKSDLNPTAGVTNPSGQPTDCSQAPPNRINLLWWVINLSILWKFHLFSFSYSVLGWHWIHFTLKCANIEQTWSTAANRRKPYTTSQLRHSPGIEDDPTGCCSWDALPSTSPNTQIKLIWLNEYLTIYTKGINFHRTDRGHVGWCNAAPFS